MSPRFALLLSLGWLAGCGATVTPASDFDPTKGDALADTRREASVDSTLEDTTVVVDDTGTIDSSVPLDTGTPFDTSTPFDSKPPPFDSKPPLDSGLPGTDKTTGKVCTSDDDCDVTGAGTNICTEGAFGGDSLYPTSVCIGRECDPGFGDVAKFCDGDLGVCLPVTGGGICLPHCKFGDSTAAPTGCAGKNKCNPYTYGKDMSGAVLGVGYCFGGCRADADCPTGNKCQVEDGLCVKTVDVYTKTIGTACTDADAKAPAKCNCLYTSVEKKGYCTTACYAGETTCATGYTCDPGLPRVALRPDDIVFTKIPTGMAGYCLKNCATDAECAPLAAYCDERAGTGKKTCQVGKRPCAKNEHCPTGTTCMGATATALGTCG